MATHAASGEDDGMAQVPTTISLGEDAPSSPSQTHSGELAPVRIPTATVERQNTPDDADIKKLALQMVGLQPGSGDVGPASGAPLVHGVNIHEKTMDVLKEALDQHIAQNTALENQCARYKAQVESLAAGVNLGIKKLMFHKNRACVLQAEVECIHMRYQELQDEHQQLKKAHRVAMNTTGPGRLRTKEARGDGAEGSVPSDLRLKVQSLTADNDHLRDNVKRLTKENQRLQRMCLTHETEKKRSDEYRKLEETQRQTLEKVRRDTRELERRLQHMAQAKVKQQQGEERARTDKVWEKIGVASSSGNVGGKTPKMPRVKTTSRA